MPAICKPSKKFMIGVVVGTVSLCAPNAAFGQCRQGTKAIGFVGVETGNPFTAERVTTTTELLPDGSKQTTSLTKFAARDGYGRLRFEKIPDWTVTKTDTSEIETTTTDKNIHGHAILLFDCNRGTLIQLDVEQKTARTREDHTPAPENLVHHPYSSGFFPPSNPKIQTKFPPNGRWQDFAYKKIEGIEARGRLVTTLGSEEDGDKNGKPIKESEALFSDDLAATILEIRRDLKTGEEGRMELIHIQRTEPDPSLFDIPPGYAINPPIAGPPPR